MSNSPHRLPLSTKIVFAFGNIGLQLMVASTSFFLLIFYTDVALVPPALAGTALLAGKLWDVVNDPLFGYLCDRTKSRFGRRRVYLIYGAAPFALSAASLWMMPAGLSTTAAFIWILVSYTIYDTLFTMISMPYAALGADLTTDYDDRTSLVAIGSGGALVGYVLGSVLMPKLVLVAPNATLGYAFAGGLLGLVAGASVGFVAWRVKEPPTRDRHPHAEGGLIEAMKSTLKMRPFVILSVALALVRLGLTLLQTSLAFYVIYRLQLGKEGLPMLMGVLLATVAITIPFWKWVCTTWSKSGAYALGITLCAIGLVLTYWVEPGQKTTMIGIMILIGMGMGAHWVAPYSMLPDVVDYAEARSGGRNTGMYYGVYGLMDKLSRTFGSVAVGWWLHWFDYIPNATQTAEADLGIRLITGPVPAVAMLLALPLLIAYPINRAAHQRVKVQLESKRSQPTTLMTRF